MALDTGGAAKTLKTAPKKTVKKASKKPAKQATGDEAALEAKMSELVRKRGAASTC